MNAEGPRWRVLAALLVSAGFCGASGCSNTLFVESAEITNGAIDGFAAGMSKEQALAVAEQKGVTNIRPVLPEEPSIDYSSASHLTFPGAGRAIELVDKHGGKVVFTLGECYVTHVQAEGDLADDWKDSRGISTEQLLGSVKAALMVNHELSINEVVNSDNRSWIVTKRLSDGNVAAVEAYNVWSFETTDAKPAGAEFTLYFAEGKLIRITYRRPRIRLE